MLSYLALDSRKGEGSIMQALWNDIYRASGNERRRDEARRIANIALALRSQLGSEVPERTAFFARMKEVAELLGGPILLNDKQATAVWKRLSAEPREKFTYAEIDSWVEAFQASDSARKSLGAYATPAPFSNALARATLAPLIGKKRALRIVDPAAGAGNLLLAAYRCLVDAGNDPAATLYGLHGAELDPAARELCILLLWISAGEHNVDLERIAANIRLANAITFDWRALGPFDVLLMNPPWESLRQTRSDPKQADIRAETLARIQRAEPGTDGLPPLYSAQGRGDRNLFKLFAELAPHLLRKGGRYGAVLPAAFGSDDGMTELRQYYFAHLSLERWTGFENRGKYFQIDSRYKFGLLTGERSAAGTQALEVLSFCTHPHEIDAAHVRLDRDEIKAIGGKDQMIPELVSPIERDLLAQMLVMGGPLFERGALGSVKYRREVDLTLGRKTGRFWHVSESKESDKPAGAQLDLMELTDIVPVIEGRMIGQYDCFQKSWVSGSARRAVWEANGDRPLSACQPQYVTHARQAAGARVAICDVTSATNTRTVLAALVPPHWVCGNTAPVLCFDTAEQAFAGLAILNSMVFDWFSRRMVGGLHLNKFYLARLTWPRLKPSDVARLGELGRIIASHHPRGGVPGKGRGLSELPVAALAEVEILTAQGYGLDRPALDAMFSTDKSDRRGLWRFFRSNPTGRAVAAMALMGHPPAPDPAKTLAA